MNTPRLLFFGLVAGGLINLSGVLLGSQAFTSATLGELQPGVFSDFGLVAIMLWGLAYIAVAGRVAAVRPLLLVFAVEKLAYGITWLCWMATHHAELDGLFGRDPLAGLFMAVYGPNDLAYMLFFLWGFFATRPTAARAENR